MTLPTHTVEIAFTTPPLDDTPAWTDVSDRVVSWRLNRGRSGEFQDFDGGTLDILLDNTDGYLTPTNASSPQFGNLLPNRLIRISKTWASVDYQEFEGLIEAFEQVVELGSDMVVLRTNLRCVDGTKVLNLERTPEFDDYPDRVTGQVFEPIWGYWRLNEPPATRVKPGGYVKTKKKGDGKKKKWRKKKTTRFLTGVSGPEALVIGNPAFLQAKDDGPVSGELSCGIRFDQGLAQHLKVPVPEADDRPGAEGSIVVSAIVKPGVGTTNTAVIVGGPMVTASPNVPAWYLMETGTGTNEFGFSVRTAGATLVTLTTSGDLVDRSGVWIHLVASYRAGHGASLYVNGVLEEHQDGVPAMSRGETAAPIYIGGHPGFTAVDAGITYYDGVIADVVISEHQAGDDYADAVLALYQSSVAGFGSPANLPTTGERIEAILDGAAEADLDASYFTTARRDISAGTMNVLPQRLDESKLEMLRRLEETEQGLLFVGKDGKLVFRDRDWLVDGTLYEGAEIKAKFSNRPFALWGISSGGNIEFETSGRQNTEFDDYLTLGVGAARVDIKWSIVEEDADGNYDWTLYDVTIGKLRDRGLDVLATLAYTPEDYRTAPGTDDKYAPADAAARQAYADFAAAVVERYYPTVKAFEIWNEPNLGGNFWKPAADPADYTDMLQRAYTAIKAVQPGAIVVAGALAGAATGGADLSWGDFLDQMYTAGAQGYFDAISTHAYIGSTDIQFDWEEFINPPGSWFGPDADSIRNLMVQNGDGNKLIWMTEVNISVLASQAAGITAITNRWTYYPWAGPLFIYSWRTTDSLSIVDGALAHRAGWDAYETFLDTAQHHQFRYRSVSPSLSDDFLFPVVTGMREGGNPQTVGDTTEFFGATLELNDTLHTSDEAVLSDVTTMQGRYGVARERVDGIEVQGLSDEHLYPHIFGREIGDRVIFHHTHPDGSQVLADCRIMGIQRSSEGQQDDAVFALEPSYMPEATDGWHLGVLLNSELQTNTVLG